MSAVQASVSRVLPLAAGVSPAKLSGYDVLAAEVLPPATVSRFGDAKDVAAAAKYVLDNVVHRSEIDLATAKQLAEETITAWNEHINPGFLQYRKSVAEADGFAALEWRDGKPGGCTVIDAKGREYIDLLGGFGIYSCGHSHPVIVEAVRQQLGKQPLHSQELLDPLRAYCADILCRTLPGDLKKGYAFFTNSGTESVEACLKFAMLSTGRRHFVGVVGAFHGKSIGSLSGTSKAIFRQPFAGMGALLPFSHIKINDCAALRAAFESAKFTGNEIAGFIVEPVIGEGGIHVCSDEFLREARRLCDEHGSCLIFDEVQSGMGRTGYWWACEHAGVAPDLMAIAKGFGGGVMGAGAAVGTEKVMSKLFDNPFIHTTTFGGNPLSLTAAIAAMYVTETEGLRENATARGEWLLARLQGLRAEFPHILKEARGRGLMLGMEFHDDDIGYTFSKGVFSRGLLLSGTLVAARVLRVEPPLTITQGELEVVIERFTDTLRAMTAAGIGMPALVASSTSAEVKALWNATPGAAISVKPKDASPTAFSPTATNGFGGPVAAAEAEAVSGTAAPPPPAAGGAATAAAAPAEDEEEDEVGTVQHPPPGAGRKSSTGSPAGAKSPQAAGRKPAAAAAAPAAAAAASSRPLSSVTAAFAAKHGNGSASDGPAVDKAALLASLESGSSGDHAGAPAARPAASSASAAPAAHSPTSTGTASANVNPAAAAAPAAGAAASLGSPLATAPAAVAAAGAAAAAMHLLAPAAEEEGRGRSRTLSSAGSTGVPCCLSTFPESSSHGRKGKAAPAAAGTAASGPAAAAPSAPAPVAAAAAAPAGRRHHHHNRPLVTAAPAAAPSAAAAAPRVPSASAEDEEDEESDVSSVSSTSTESGGMDDEDEE